MCPGIDGVTTEHMFYALSTPFELMNLYNTMFNINVIPDVLQIGVIVPILRKSTLSSTVCENFWPITLSSVHAKLVEMFILPNTKTNICGNQYGYLAGSGTEFCCPLLNDCIAYFNEGNSPVYMCTLDAVKCFDNIWHEVLFYKLRNRMDIVYWRLLYNWYKSIRVTVLLNGEYSEFFSVTKGIRQSSMLSPYLFKIFIDELMGNLESWLYGIRIG